MGKYYLGIDIGGTKIKTVILDNGGAIIGKDETLTEDSPLNKGVWKEKIIALIHEKSEKYGKGAFNDLICGISAPGLVDVENKKTLYMPERLEGIENFDWSGALQRDIRVINDGHSACLAEYESFYRAEGIQDMLMLTLGTGVGGGIIIGGKLHQGHLQRAGHVGHMTLGHKGPQTMTNMPGSLEYAVGNFSVLERTHGTYKNVQELVNAHQKGNAMATLWWLESVEKLAIALASLNNILAPQLIVLGGGIVAGAKESLMAPLRDFMHLYEWRPGKNTVKVTEAKHGGYAGAIGAAFYAKNNHKK